MYADDTIVYCSAPSKQQSVTAIQSVFDIIQNRFCALKLVLNVEKNEMYAIVMTDCNYVVYLYMQTRLPILARTLLEKRF